MKADLSPAGRRANLLRMRSEPFDVLVIGGGIVGAGVARDAATRGFATALVDRGDFASGTSGKTSRLVHGGLRYLRDYRIGLVRDAVRERDVLLRRAPSLVHPLRFTIPVYEGRGPRPLALRVGLVVYDLLSRGKVLPRHAYLRPSAILEAEPRLRSHGLLGGGTYHDAWTDDARLVLAVVRDAANGGAVVANYADVTELVRREGRVQGARVTDRESGETFEVRASVVINATGAGIDSLRGGPTPRGTVRLTKGAHVLLPAGRIGTREAVVLSARDGRAVFVLPWAHLVLVGTTDTDFEGPPNRVVPDARDVAYLLETVNDAFPEANARPEDVVSAYAGLRPLIRGRSSSEDESDVSRAHRIFEDPDGLVSVAGGKLTTHRKMAEDVVDLLGRRIGRRTACVTSLRDLGPSAQALDDIRALGFDGPATAHLASRHAPQELLPWLSEPGARAAISTELPYLWIEVDIAVGSEMALTLADVLVRRVPFFYEAEDQGLSLAADVAGRMARHLGWTASRIEEEVRAHEALIADHRRFR